MATTVSRQAAQPGTFSTAHRRGRGPTPVGPVHPDHHRPGHPAVADHGHGTRGVDHQVVADRAQQHAGPPVVAPGPRATRSAEAAAASSGGTPALPACSSLVTATDGAAVDSVATAASSRDAASTWPPEKACRSTRSADRRRASAAAHVSARPEPGEV